MNSFNLKESIDLKMHLIMVVLRPGRIVLQKGQFHWLYLTELLIINAIQNIIAYL